MQNGTKPRIEDSGIFYIMNPANGNHNSGQMEISFPVIGKSSL